MFTAATATAITALPYSLSVDVSGSAAPNYDAWWSFTSSTAGVIGMKPAAASGAVDYVPETTVWYGTPSSLTQLTVIGSGSVAAINRPLFFPVVANVTYYVRVRNSTGLAPDANLEFTAAAAPNASVPQDAILISTVDGDMPIIALDPTTGATLGFPVVSFAPGGDYAAILPATGRSIWPFDTNVYRIYDSGFALVATVTALSGYGPGQYKPVSTNRNDTFYICAGGTGGGMGIVDTVSNTGTVGGTTWTLGHTNVTSIAPTLDESTLYYTVELTNGVFAWDLGTDTALATFATHGGSTWRAVNVIVLADTSVVVLWAQSGAPFAVEAVRYDAAGAVLNTYSLGTASPKFVGHAPDDPVSFWVWQNDNNTATFTRIRASDGVALVTFTTALQSGQVYARSDYATVDVEDAFVPSTTCPFLLWYSAQEPIPPLVPIPPPESEESGSDGFPGVSPYRRRLRTFPHLSAEQVWAFHKSLQIDMETGVGVSNPYAQGYDPVVFLRWSDDGGHTWSNSHEKSLGLQGQYRHRIIYRQLGRSRDRIYELSMSDPVRANVIAGYLDAESGIA